MRLFVNLLIIILIFAVFNKFINDLVPKYKEYLNVVQLKNEKINALKKVESIEKLFQSLEIKQKETINEILLSKQKGEFDIFLPDKFSDYELILLINSLSRASGLLEPNVYTFEEEKMKLPFIKSIELIKKNFTLSGETSYNNVISLIKNFENHSRFFTVNKLTLNKKEDKIDFNINIGTYYLGSIVLIR